MENESRLAEFVNALIEETLSSVQSTYLDQIDRKLEAHRFASAPLEEIAAQLDDDDVKEAIAEKRFPNARSEKAVRLEIAREEQALLNVVLDQGFPNLIIDHGKINAKLDFSFNTTEAISSKKNGITAKEKENLTARERARLKKAGANHQLKTRPQLKAGTHIERFSKTKLSSHILSKQPQISASALQINVRPKDEKNVSTTGSSAGNAAIDIDLNFKVIY